MSDTYTVAVGGKGRVVVPAAVREHHGWSEGTVLIAVETDEGLVLMDREAAKRRVRAQFHDGVSLVESLLADRRAAAATEDA